MKLIDFGIASFFTGSGKHFQLFGTEGFTAPEALRGLPVETAADIYSLGKVLGCLAENAVPPCSTQVSAIIRRASSPLPSERYESAVNLKNALISAQNTACRHISHLIRNIAVIGSRPGAGATHFSISMVSTLNKKGHPAIYRPADGTDTLSAIARNNSFVKEQNGIYYYEYFRGFPDYGDGIEDTLLSPENCVVQDFGTSIKQLEDPGLYDFIFFILSGSDWDFLHSAAFCRKLQQQEKVIFICNYHNRKAARKFARTIGRKIYCFPLDPDPYRVTHEKERLISAIFHQKGGVKNIRF